MRDDTWVSVTGNSNEINIGAGTLARRPLKMYAPRSCMRWSITTVTSTALKTQAEATPYHKKRFKEVAESHGLIVKHDEKYGWTLTLAER